jgi:predicted KAP-like P-loop ATPase
MPQYLSDSPIETPDDDRYGVSGFAKSISKSIINLRKPVGTVIALNGAWGSGKSSIVNLVRTEIAATQIEARTTEAEKLIVTEFKCWWFRGEEALLLAFLQHMSGMLKDSLGEKAANIVAGVSRPLLQATPTIGAVLGAGTANPIWAAMGGGANILEKLLFKDDTVEKAFAKLSTLLADTNKRFLVIIDDIDRLSPDEALAIFRMVKSVGHLPNITYLLVFDRELAEATVKLKYPSEGPHFLEKIVQASFDVPTPNQTDLNGAILASIQEICGGVAERQWTRMGNVFLDVVSPYMTTPRHVARLAGAISVTWPAVANNVNLADFIALETLRLYEPSAFKNVRERRNAVTGIRTQGDRDGRNENRFDPYLHGIPAARHASVRVALQRLFPRLETTGYGTHSLAGWDVERRVCVPKHFETYLRSMLSDETLPMDEISELVRRAGDVDFVKQKFLGAAAKRRRNGTSFIPVYFDELTSHVGEIARKDIEPFLRALFEVHGEIDLPEDEEKGFGAFADTRLRVHWLIRRLTEDLSIEDRSTIYLGAIRSASLEWLIEFARSARSDYQPEGTSEPTPPERCLVTQETVGPIVDLALTAMRAAAADRRLLAVRGLIYVLYAWRRFDGSDPTEVRAWTDGLLKDDRAVLTLMRAFTGRSYGFSMGFGGMGDRVSTPRVNVFVSDDMDILDAAAFRGALERMVAERRADAETLESVQSFLDAWDAKRGEERRRSGPRWPSAEITFESG